jgi:hypothetical protein
LIFCWCVHTLSFVFSSSVLRRKVTPPDGSEYSPGYQEMPIFPLDSQPRAGGLPLFRLG